MKHFNRVNYVRQSEYNYLRDKEEYYLMMVNIYFRIAYKRKNVSPYILDKVMRNIDLCNNERAILEIEYRAFKRGIRLMRNQPPLGG